MEIKRFIGGMLDANCYVISAKTGKCFIIDPGYNPKKIIKYVKDEGLEVEGIILTHHHYDHCDGAPRISKELDCPIMIHRLDADMYKKGADVILEDGDVLELGDEKLVVFNTPGHTRGGICIYSSKSRLCFTGDTIFNVDLGRTDLEDGSEEEMRQSILNVCDTWGNDVTIYPGHGDPANMKTVRKINKEFLEIVNGN
ncbi:MAG: MBL fold metallo-hydrolase [Bacillota bacterium]|nr:MBL fold metallo-hydrolase [Bacillota bacterium]